MAEVQKSAFVPAAIHAQNGRIPDLFLTSGEVGVRGYAAQFFNVNGELIKPSATQNLTCYALNLMTEKGYYTEGTYTEDTWYIEVPRQAVESDGRVAIQLALKEGDSALLITDTSVVDVHNFLGGDSSRPLDADNGILMDYQKLHAQAEAAEKVLSDIKTTTAHAENLAKQAREDITKIEAKEASRDSAETKRQSAEGARVQAENSRITQEGARERTEGMRVEAEEDRVSAEKNRTTAESVRVSTENERIAAEKVRADKESARQSAESARVEEERKRSSQESARVSAESSRVSQESVRQANENARKSQESDRVSAESSRVTAEEKRKQTFDSWDKTMQGVFPQADETKPGVVKAKGTAKESAPYTVPSIGVLEEVMKKAGQVKSVNGMVGDVRIPEYTLPSATESELGGVVIRQEYGGATEPEINDTPPINPGDPEPGAQNKKVIVPTLQYVETYVGHHILDSEDSVLYPMYHGTAAGVSYVDNVIKSFEGGVRTQMNLKQDKIKQVVGVPTVATTKSDPEGTIYISFPDGQQGGAVGALTLADVEQMGLPVTDESVPYGLKKDVDKYLLMKGFSLKFVAKTDAMEAGFYTEKTNPSFLAQHDCGNNILDSAFQYYDGKDFVKKRIYGSKPFLQRFRAGNFALDVRDFGALEGVTVGKYEETDYAVSFLETSSSKEKNNAIIGRDKSMFCGIKEKTLFPGCLIDDGGEYSRATQEFNMLGGDLYFLEKVDNTTETGKTTYGYRSIAFDSGLSPYKKTLHYLFSAYQPKSPIYTKRQGRLTAPDMLFIKRNGKIVQL